MISKCTQSQYVSTHNAENGGSSEGVFDENVEEIADRLSHRLSQEQSLQDTCRRHHAISYLRAAFANVERRR